MGETQVQFNRDLSHESGIFALSKKFQLTSINYGAQKILGKLPALGDIVPLERIFEERVLGRLRPFMDAVLNQGKRYTGQKISFLREDGSCIFCELSIHPLITGNQQIIGMLFLFTPNNGLDQTRIQSNTVSRKYPSLDSHEGLYHNLPKGSFTIDDHWCITGFNKAAAEITGFSEEEALGRHCWDIFRSEQCHQECPMRIAMDRKKPEMDRQITVINRHGVRQILSVNVNLLKNGKGEINGAVETFHPAGEMNPNLFNAPGRLLGMVGNSPTMRNLFAKLSDLAISKANVLICGESGTGKELVARTLHNLSKNRKAPFVAVNCCALAETLIEAELFGQEKGAFTGADQSRAGRFELAGSGSLLLDEIGELRPDLQVKLLRVIEHRSFERVGGTKSISFDARLISATHQDLALAIKERRFREDLYYRLRTVTLTIPPLRKRIEDIPLLVEHFIKHFNAKTGKRVRSLDPKVMRRLESYHWPGNVRELERCIEHAFVFVKGPVIFGHYLPELNGSDTITIDVVPNTSGNRNGTGKEDILRALEQAGQRKKQAADILGISRTSMWRRMKALGIE